MPLNLDNSRLPLVFIRWEGLPTDAEFDRYLDGLRDTMKKKRKFVNIFDLTDAKAPTSRQLNLQTEYIRSEAPAILTYSLGSLFVAPTFLVRTLLKGVLAYQPPVEGYKVFGTNDEALQEAKSRLQKAGVIV